MTRIGRAEVEASLAAHPVDALQQVLRAANLPAPDEAVARDHAAQITRALWWHYSTPLGFALDRASLDDIVDHVASKLQIAGALPQGSAWDRLEAMSSLLDAAARGYALNDLDPKVRARLVPSWKRTAAYASGATGSFGAFAAGRGVVALSRTTLGRLLPYVPRVGPWVGRAYRGGALAATLGGPVGLALGLLAANNALGANYHRLVPLLLGVGTLGRGAYTATELPSAP